MTKRLNPSTRRDLIVDAAIPLFARKGFAGTTTREIAEAAGVSEALVFKHFANKTALYDAIVAQYHETNPTFEELRTLPPSTQTLIGIVRFTTHYFAALANDDDESSRCRYRMFFRSLSEDGVFAGIGVDAYADELNRLFVQSFDKARCSEDLTDSAPDANTAFWMMARQHLMLAAWSLFPDQSMPEPSVDDSVLFILRGIGVRDSVLKLLAAARGIPADVSATHDRVGAPHARTPA